MLVKCQICGNKIDKDTAYKRVVNGKNFYYHSEEEYNTDLAKKAKTKADKDRAYRLVCDILGVPEIINTALWREWQTWNRVKTDEIIAQYLEENKEELTRLIARLDSAIYPRIRYLSAVLKNKLGDYKPKVSEKIEPRESTFTVFEPVATVKQGRRSFAELEDEI